MAKLELVSHSQTAFSSFVLGWEEKGSGERCIAVLFWQSPSFEDSTCTAFNLWQVLVTQSSRDAGLVS